MSQIFSINYFPFFQLLHLLLRFLMMIRRTTFWMMICTKIYSWIESDQKWMKRKLILQMLCMDWSQCMGWWRRRGEDTVWGVEWVVIISQMLVASNPVVVVTFGVPIADAHGLDCFKSCFETNQDKDAFSFGLNGEKGNHVWEREWEWVNQIKNVTVDKKELCVNLCNSSVLVM